MWIFFFVGIERDTTHQLDLIVGGLSENAVHASNGHFHTDNDVKTCENPFQAVEESHPIV